MSLTELSIKRPSFVIVIFALIAVFGIISYSALSYELLPKFNIPTLTVATIYPGASPSEIESQVTKKIEDNISTLENIKRIRSSSYENLSIVIIELNSGTDVDEALSEAQRKLNGVAPLLPDNAKTPTVSKVSSDAFPILKYSLSSSINSNTEFYQFVKDKILPELSSVKGVANIDLIGGEERAIRVYVDEEKLEAQNLSLLMVTQAIAQNNLDFPTGKVENQATSLKIKLAGKYQSVEEIEELVIARFQSGTQVKLKDIATIIDSKKDVETINRINGETAIGMNIVKQGDANAVDVAAIIQEKTKKLEEKYASQNLQMNVAVNTTDFTIAAADAVKFDLMLAIFLVALVILIFLHSFRDSLIVMLAIPCSFLGTFIAIYLFGYTLNLITLLALTLVVGILVDDSIVVLENIHRHLAMGKDKKTASIDGRNEIGFTAIAITFVDVVVFLPLALTKAGIVSVIFSQFSWVIVVSTLLSLFVCFTVTPLLASRFSKLVDLEKEDYWTKVNKWIETQIEYLIEWYVGILKWTLSHKIVTLSLIFLLFVGSISLVVTGFIGSTFIEQGDRGEVLFYLETEKSSTIEYTDKITKQVEKEFMAMPEVQTVIASVGISGGGREAGGLNPYKSELTVKLKEDTKLGDAEFAEKAKKQIGKMTGVKIEDALIGIMGSADDSPVQLIISGNEFETVLEAGQDLKQIIRNIAGTKNVNVSIEGGVPEVRVKIDKEKMASLGLNVTTIGATMANAYSGNDDSQFSEAGTEYDIIVQLNDFDRKNPDDVKSLSFVNNKGKLIRLDQFATISAGTAPSQLERTDRESSVKVKASLIGRQIGAVSKEINEAIAKADFEAKGVDIIWIGQQADQAESFGAIGGAFGLSIVLIYLLMVLLYDNYIYPIVVLLAIPMALIGAFLALALAKSSLSIFTMMGLVVMTGLVCKNSILIVDFANKAKEEGMNSLNAIIEGGRERLRPIMMTTIAMVLGMFPVAVASGAGASWKNGLGWTLMGGLTSSMCLTIFIVPIMYLVVDYSKEYLANRKSKKSEKKIQLANG
ncbi:efflux RND transporter permease subunit [Bernardetia sp. Wsw4-3y2]|uniref:efflux RND transporter permease subunit n=1 Tax=Bernardetia sp. Wsw4-3y2 TaxID=3127471 RepID=UPI0030D3EA9B